MAGFWQGNLIDRATVWRKVGVDDRGNNTYDNGNVYACRWQGAEGRSKEDSFDMIRDESVFYFSDEVRIGDMVKEGAHLHDNPYAVGARQVMMANKTHPLTNNENYLYKIEL